MLISAWIQPKQVYRYDSQTLQQARKKSKAKAFLQGLVLAEKWKAKPESERVYPEYVPEKKTFEELEREAMEREAEARAKEAEARAKELAEKKAAAKKRPKKPPTPRATTTTTAASLKRKRWSDFSEDEAGEEDGVDSETERYQNSKKPKIDVTIESKMPSVLLHSNSERGANLSRQERRQRLLRFMGLRPPVGVEEVVEFQKIRMERAAIKGLIEKEEREKEKEKEKEEKRKKKAKEKKEKEKKKKGTKRKAEKQGKKKGSTKKQKTSGSKSSKKKKGEDAKKKTSKKESTPNNKKKKTTSSPKKKKTEKGKKYTTTKNNNKGKTSNGRKK